MCIRDRRWTAHSLDYEYRYDAQLKVQAALMIYDQYEERTVAQIIVNEVCPLSPGLHPKIDPAPTHCNLEFFY